MLVKSKNPWGSQQEAQRADLWRIDLVPVFKLVSDPQGLLISNQYKELLKSIPEEDDLLDYATQRIVLPESIIATKPFITGTRPVQMPGYDEPPGPTRIDFIHETGTATHAAGILRSGVYCLLQAWRLLTMAGQQNFQDKPVLALKTPKSRPNFACDIKVQMLQGTEDGTGLENSTAYLLQGSWISELQVNDLDYANGRQLLMITTTIQAAAIIPSPAQGSTSAGWTLAPFRQH